MVVKWLSIPVGDYLVQSSPLMDYTQDTIHFIKTFQGDVDVGAMFNIFVFHESERHSLGVRFIHTDPLSQVERETIERFCVLNFGNMTSPYVACQGQTRIIELAMRPPTDSTSAFQWTRVKQKLAIQLAVRAILTSGSIAMKRQGACLSTGHLYS